jgi:uncharacterized protein
MKPNYRRCVSCRQVRLKQDFWRVVRVFPSGNVQLDQGMGRSAYLCPQESCLQAGRCLWPAKLSVHRTVPDTLYQTLWQRLQQSDPQHLR